MAKIVGADQQRYFVDENGTRFFPWGFNYTNPQHVGLLEDNWYEADTWRLIAEDFSEMRALSANAVRVHLQYHRFMRDPETPDTRAFDQLVRLVDVARESGLYLLVTGLGAYRKSDAPAWYAHLDTPERWRTQALFWHTVAERIGHRKAVFAYDLMNEPVVGRCAGAPSACSWQVGEPFGGFHFIQNISIDPEAPAIDTTRAWIQAMTAAIREADAVTPITAGFLPVAPPSMFEQDLDFVSTHVYPHRGKVAQSIRLLQKSGDLRPLVISEILNLYGEMDDVVRVLEAVRGRNRGLFSHYDGRTLAELAATTEVDACLRQAFLEFFVSGKSRYGSPGRDPGAQGGDAAASDEECDKP